MIINKGTLSALFTGFNSQFQAGFATAQSDYAQVAMTVPSNTKQETYGWLGKTTQFREWLGDRVIQNLESHDYTIKNKDFENTVGVDRNDILDDTLGVYSPILAQLGQDAAVHPDQLVFSLLKAGFTNLCFDGQPFFNASHPVGASTSSNFATGAATPWYLLDTTRVIKPLILQKRQEYKFTSLQNDTDENVFMRKQFIYGVDARVNVGYGLWQLAFGSKVALDTTSYADARTKMMSQLNDNGQPMGIRPTLLVVPPSLEGAALAILNAEMTGSGNTNVLRNTAQLLVSPWVI
jgi:phage major head subunit gpT-like protein